MSAHNRRTRNNPVVFIHAPSAYYGKRVKILRSKQADKVGAVGQVVVHDSARGMLHIVFDDWSDLWTHVDNVALVTEQNPCATKSQ